ncbi:MAG: aminopeptidase P family protein, partial [Deltaproteobacteria bacterium]|nr:aminopeptidase P family protein [Deltaproteobacteria bacterium]
MTSHMTHAPTYDLVPSDEIFSRISRLQRELVDAGLDGAIIPDGINMFYYTGTLQNGVLFVPADGDPLFFIRRSFERAKKETPLKAVLRFTELLPTVDSYGYQVGTLGVDETTVAVSIFKKLSAAFPKTVFEDISLRLSMIRSVKSEYEIGLIREAGKRHKVIYDHIPGIIREGMTEWELGSAIHAHMLKPGIIREGMTEWELGSAIHAHMLKLGYTGLGRLAAFNTEFFAGVISFGESGNYPSASVGPDGLVGLSPAFPFLGGAKRLIKSEIAFIDTGFAYQGYFTDKTRIFVLNSLSQTAADAHKICVDIQEAVRRRLKPGAIPSEIFSEVYQTEVVSRNFEEHFMGFGSNQVLFLGHGIGLVIDEFPVIAGRIDSPLQENMIIAVEPKKGIAGIGLVG